MFTELRTSRRDAQTPEKQTPRMTGDVFENGDKKKGEVQKGLL
jgi:hypothetical protein